jgi:hypothetical protein
MSRLMNRLMIRLLPLVGAFSVAILLFPGPSLTQAEELLYDLDFAIPQAVAPSPITLGGTLEAKAVTRLLDRSALLYAQRFTDADQPTAFSELGLTFKPEITARRDPFSAYLRPRMDLRWSQDQRSQAARDEPSAQFFSDSSLWAGGVMLEEAVVGFWPSHGLSVDVGKKVVKWGKGYAWNPTGFAARPKDVDDPDQTREGYLLLAADWIKSLDGPLTTVGLNPVLIPVTSEINQGLATDSTLLYGGKLTLLAWDTDIDLLFLDGRDFDQRLGLALARNLAPHFVVHAELALRRDFQKYTYEPDGSLAASRKDAPSLLLGLRYVNSMDTTFILEYLHNGEGLDRQEMQGYLDGIKAGIAAWAQGDPAPLRASRAAASLFNKNSVMRDYLYLRVFHKEPFGLLYVTPALTVLANVDDNSLTINPELTWSPRQNYDLKAKLAFPLGPGNSEYGSKLHHVRGEVTLTRYF